jgi:two-component system, NarL family, invasion response regulator UvrY
MAKVLLIDDHPMVRAGLRQILKEDRHIGEIGEAASAAEATEVLRTWQWDLVILDIHMPDRSGMEILRHMRSEHPRTKILVLSGLPERQYAINAVKAGASGYLPKECAPQDLLSAVRTVLQGRRYVSPGLLQVLTEDIDGDSSEPLHRRLSEREFQIFRRLAAGRTVSGIGNELRLSVKTVSTYRTRILEKMNLTTNADLTMYAIRNEISPTTPA